MANIVRRRGETLPAQQGELEPFRWVNELFRWDPFREMMQFPLGGEEALRFVPNFDVKETKDAYLFKADVPGLKEEDIEISITGNRLSVNGKREMEERQEGERYYAYERAYGTFTRSFTLPDGADPEHVQAEMRDGVLTVVLPKKPESQPKKVILKGKTTQKS